MNRTTIVTGTRAECLRALSQKGLAERWGARERWIQALLAGEEAVSIWVPSYGSSAGRASVVRARLKEEEVRS